MSSHGLLHSRHMSRLDEDRIRRVLASVDGAGRFLVQRHPNPDGSALFVKLIDTHRRVTGEQDQHTAALRAVVRLLWAAGFDVWENPTARPSRVELQVTALPDHGESATHSVPADPQAVAVARHFVSRTLGAWGLQTATVDHATLCVSELVTNAIRHARAGCELRLHRDRGVLITTVRDWGAGAGAHPEHLTVDLLGGHGRGLHIVDALATAWGSTQDTTGTTVWFALDADQETAINRTAAPSKPVNDQPVSHCSRV